MKHLFLTLFLCLVSLPAYSQIIPKTFNLSCLPQDVLASMIEKNQWMAQTAYLDKYDGYVVEVYHKPDKSQYSIILRYPNGIGCLILLGDTRVEINEQPDSL